MSFRFVVLALLLCTSAGRAFAYSLTGTRWRAAAVTMQLQLGPTATVLSDGLASWDAAAEDAFNVWNSHISATKFNVVRDSTATRAEGNRINNVFFSGDVYGDAWGSGVLAVTLTYRSGTSNTETDVLFNNRMNWNSYRGALRYSASGAAIQDFHRVALHEFGHVLGLDHPDEEGQRVSAIMNSHVSSLDALTADDISGAQSLYGAAPATSTPSAPAVAPPSITASPSSRTVSVGQSTTFTVGVSSTVTVTYQWLKSGAPISGATAASFTLGSVAATDAGNYSVVVSNSSGSVTSPAATLTVTPVAAPTTPTTPTTPATPNAPATPAPAVITAPVAQTVAAGDRVSLSVVTASGVAVSYQWIKDGVEIPGATGAVFTLETARAADGGSYAVRISNSAGSVTTATVAVTVKFSRLVNLSTRGFIPAGGALTPGFYIRGTRSKPLLIRAVGPTLSLFGVGTAIAEAKLDVVAQDSSTIVASNNDWGGGTALQAAFANVGAFPLAADSKDAAVQSNLVPAGYTVRVTTGDSSTSGVSLAEIYDAETLNGSAAQLVNVSTLAFVGSGDQVLTAGFVISGNAPKRLLIRAVGPGLGAFGVTSLLPDPQLGLVRLGGVEPIATNDDWSDSASVRSAFASAGAFSLTSGSKDAVLIVTLEPGGYTAIVSGVSGTASGNALVEIYDLDP